MCVYCLNSIRVFIVELLVEKWIVYHTYTHSFILEYKTCTNLFTRAHISNVCLSILSPNPFSSHFVDFFVFRFYVILIFIISFPSIVVRLIYKIDVLSCVFFFVCQANKQRTQAVESEFVSDAFKTTEQDLDEVKAGMKLLGIATLPKQTDTKSGKHWTNEPLHLWPHRGRQNGRD